MSVESAFTINKISSVLNCNVVYDNLKKCIIDCYKRCLTYSLYKQL